MADLDLSSLITGTPSAAPAPEASEPLQTADFTAYDTVADGTLKLKELSASGKLDEFLARFYATPAGSAAYFVERFSRTLTDHVKEDIASRLESPDLDPAVKTRLEYWANHDFKKRAVAASVRLPFYYQRIRESTYFGGFSTEETTSAPWLGVGGEILTETKLGDWRWYNEFSAETDWQYGTYRADADGVPVANGTEEGAYGFVSLSSEAKLRERTSLNGSVTYDNVANPLPETQKSSLAVNGGASHAWELRAGESVEAKAGGGYVKSVEAPAVLGSLGQSSYLHKNASGSLAYQSGGRGLIFSATYYDILSVNDFQTLDMGLAEGLLTYRSSPWKNATLSIGAGGARSTFGSDLTGLSTSDGKVRLNASLIAPLGGGFSSETTLSGGPSASSGSLSGWYGEIETASQTVRYASDAFSLGATLAAEGYSRSLDYVDESGASQGEQKQTQFGASIGTNASWSPGDAFSVNGSAKWSVTDQGGFQAVDSDTFSGTLGTSLRLTGESAKRAAWFNLYAMRSAQFSAFGEDFYDHAETHAMASITIK